MKRYLSPKNISILVFVLGVIGSFVPAIRYPVEFVVLTFFGSVALFAIHELGHAIVGMRKGERLESMIFGPVAIVRKSNKLRWTENRSWIKFGGEVRANLGSIPLDSKRVVWRSILIGGPVTSGIVGLILVLAGLVYSGLSSDISFILGFCSIMMAVVTGNPNAMGDGGKARQLMKEGVNASRALALLMLSEEVMTETMPSAWNQEAVEMAIRVLDNPGSLSDKVAREFDSSLRVFMYFYFIDTGEIASAKNILEQVCWKLPNQKQSKMKSGIVASLYATHLSIYDGDGEQAKKVIPLISKLEPYSYYRALGAIFAALGDKMEAMRNIEKASNLLLATGYAKVGCGKIEMDWMDRMKSMVGVN